MSKIDELMEVIEEKNYEDALRKYEELGEEVDKMEKRWRTRPKDRSSVYRGERCAECGKPERLLRCGQCKSAYYCCKEHQQMHWKVHKPDCVKDRSNVYYGNAHLDRNLIKK